MQDVAPLFEIRPPNPSEFDETGELVAAAFTDSGDTVANLVVQLRKLWDAGRGFELIAASTDGALGHVGFTRGFLDSLDRLRHVLVLSPLAVRPGVQGQGIGSALVRAGLDEASRRGFDLVFLEGAPRLYPKLGFVEAGRHGFGKPSVRIPDRAFQVYFLTEAGRSLSGQLVYPEVFWECDCVGLRDQE
ncbi:MAG TPA: N-acetyltransferase [Chloroflexota bacterium]|nr:N-acetyltransferase [Chloroflexota bacterium]